MKSVFVSGNFNVLHPGHIRLFKFAKERGDKLIVGVFSDDIATPEAFVPQDLRIEAITSNNFVDNVVLIETSLEDTLKKIRPDVIVKGKEHEGGLNPEQAFVDQYGGEVVFGSGDFVFSSKDLINSELINTKVRKSAFPESYILRHKIERERLREILLNFANLRVVVVGDLIIDEYINCEALGLSQEDSSVVLTPIDSAKYVGGAGIVALHASSLGAKTTFVSVVGDDAEGVSAKKELVDRKVHSHFVLDKSRMTTLKQRYRAKGKTNFRLTRVQQGTISAKMQEGILEQVEELLKDADLLIFSDFNYGCLPDELVKKIVGVAVSQRVFIAADSQSSSQFGDVAKFDGVDLLTPTEYEARLSLRTQVDGLAVLARRIQSKTNAKKVILKLGGDGILVQDESLGESSKNTDIIPALNSNPVDVAGAGDSLLTVAAMAIVSGGTLFEAAYLGSIAASIQVSRVGNVPLTYPELIAEIF